MLKSIYVYIIINLLLHNRLIIALGKKDINAIEEKYLNNKVKVKPSFGFSDNIKRSLINARGMEEYDVRGRKKKRGVSNTFFITNKKTNNIQNQEINNNNTEYFSKNYLNEEMTEEEYNAFVEELLFIEEEN